MDSKEIRKNADRILYDYGLLDKLKDYGVPHMIGSYRMDMMAWNDLDIDIENDAMSMTKLYQLSEYIIKTFQPSWYEAKEEINADGKRVWFHGFEAVVNRELWNVDLWFFDKETIEKAEQYCDRISKSAAAIQKEHIIAIKRELISKGLYSFEKFTSMDVYKAVIDEHVEDIGEFLEKYKRSEPEIEKL